jgi:transcription initiation factor TFIID TATA-box-binding protein
MTKSRTVNVVATANLEQKLNLEDLAKAGFVYHDEAVYGGRVGYFRSNSFPGEVTLFPSGKMIGVGATSVRQAFDQLEFVRDSLAKNGVIGHVVLKPKVQNIVAIIDVEKRFELERLSLELDLEFEPEQFPGAIMRLSEPCATTVLLFSSGKVVVTGVKTDKDLQTIRQYLENVVASHSK